MKIEVGNVFGEYLIRSYELKHNIFLGHNIECWSIADISETIEIVYKGGYDGMIEFLEEKGLLDAD